MSTSVATIEHTTRRRIPLRVRVIRNGRRTFHRLIWLTRLAAATVALVGVLAILAAIPIVNIVVLGYLLEAEGRLGRGVRFRSVLPGVRYAPRIALIACGTTCYLLPLVFISDVARDAHFIHPTRSAWLVSQLCVTTLALITGTAPFFVLARGGSLWAFLRPLHSTRIGIRAIRNETFAGRLAHKFRRFLQEVRPIPTFGTGVRGLLIALIWLLPASLLLVHAGEANGLQLIIKAIGLLLLATTFALLLPLQANFAVHNRFRSGFAIRDALSNWSRAPFTWFIAAVVTAGLSLPLFLFKIIAPPDDAMWLLTPLFVAAMLPARITTGLAYRWAARRARKSHLVVRALAVLAMFAVGLTYAGGVYAAQFVNEHGRWALFEQHAFALPVPF